MLTLNETFSAPNADDAWSVINDLDTLVPCVPGARVTSVESGRSVKAEIEVRMGAMGMTFTGPVNIESADAATRTVTIRANTRETLGQSYATGDIRICLADGGGTIDAVANVGGKAAGMGEGVIVNVLTNLVTAFSANVGIAVEQFAGETAAEDHAPGEEHDATPLEQQPEQAVATAGATTGGGQDPGAVFRSITRCFGGRLDVKLTTGPDDAPLLKAGGESFAMLHDDALVVRLHPMRCAGLIDAGKGRLLVLNGETHKDWFVVNGLDGAEWTAHTMEALACAQD